MGVSSTTRQSRSPVPPPRTGATPLPRMRNTRPVWVSAAILTRTRPSRAGHDPEAMAKHWAGLGLSGYLESDPAVEGGHFQLSAQRRIGKADGHLAVKVAAVPLKDGVLAHRNLHVQVTGRTAVGAGLALAGQADAIRGGHPRRHLDRH